ncbi:MAG: transglycosylase SLT domain-containing protein [Paludibacteraceae bacterium]
MIDLRHTLIFVLLSVLTSGCKNLNQSSNEIGTKNTETIPQDTLRIATQYGATSYFYYSDITMGFDYEMIKNFASFLHLPMKVLVAKNDNEMIAWLQHGIVEIAAYNMFETKELKNNFNFVFPQQESYLVIVQHIDRYAVSNPLELVGKEVWVKENTVHHLRLQKLNEEIGGGIAIKLAADSLSTDDLMQMVSDKKIKYTIAYRHKALLQQNFDSRLDCRIPIGFNQQNGWLVRKTNQTLTDTIRYWLAQKSTVNFTEKLYTKYWDKNPYFSYKNLHTPKGAISPYDSFFKKYSSIIGWDWRLLAAVGYAESEFNKNATSWAGAKGIMQLMPQTGREFGLNESNFTDPESNIAAGAEYIKSLNMIYRRIEDKEERIKFILASYNSGPAHIIDAMALAEKYGKNKYIWYNNVEYYLSKKNDPEYYNDPVVKYGFFRPKETLRYVPFVMDTYQQYMNKSRK